MSPNLPMPESDRILTIIGVFGGNPVIVHGRIVAVSPSAVVIRLPDEGQDEALARGNLTLMYSVNEDAYTVKAEWGERLPGGQALLRTVADPQYGERREFIRAVLELPLALSRLSEHQQSEEAALEAAEEVKGDPSCLSWRPVSVDLSGSGVRLRGPGGLRKGELVLVGLELKAAVDDGLDSRVVLAARVVRVKTVEDDEADVALQFLAVPPQEADLIHAEVFAARLAVVEGS